MVCDLSTPGLLKILTVSPGPTFSVADVYNGWVRGLRANGVEVIEYPFADRLYHAQRFHVKKAGEFVQAFPFPQKQRQQLHLSSQ